MSKTKPKPKLRGATLIREMFAPKGAAFTINQVVARMGLHGKTPKASAAAVFSVLANPAKTKNPIRISLDRETKKYSLQPGWAPGPGTPPKAKPEAKAAPKKVGKRKVGKRKVAKAAPTLALV